MKRRRELTNPETSESYEHYDAFISYATAADKALAVALRNRLRRVGAGLPGTGRGRRRPQLRVYLDQRSTPASGELSDELKRALDASRALILLASPQAANSVWTNLEIEWWRERDAGRPILIARTGGELGWDKEAVDFEVTGAETNAVPPALRGFYKQEPKWVDLRPYRRRRLIHPKLALLLPPAHTVMCQLAAPVYGEKVEVLLKEERRRHRWIRSLIAFFVATALLVGWVVWKDARDDADAQERLATSRALAHRSAKEARVDPVLAAKLSLAAYGVEQTPESKIALIERMDQMRHVQSIRDHHVEGTVSFTATVVGPNNLFAFSGHDGSTIEVWDAAEQRRVHVLTAPVSDDVPVGAGGEGWGDIDQLAISGDGRWLFAHQIGHGTRSWDLTDGGREGTFSGELASPFALQRNGSLLAGPGNIDLGEEGPVVAGLVGGNGLELWDPARNSLTTAPPLGERLRIDDVVFSADGRSVLALATDIDSDRMTLRRWDLQRRRWLPENEALAVLGESAVFSPDGGRVAVVRDRRVEFLSTKDGSRLGRASLPAGCDGYDLKSAADGRTVVVACGNGRVFALDLRSGSLTQLFRHAEGVRALAVGSDGQQVLSTDRQQLALTTPERDNRFRRLPWGAHAHRPLAEWDGAGRLGVLEDDHIAVYDPEGSELVDRSEPGDTRGTEWIDLAFSPDGRHLTTIGVSRDVYRVVRWRRSPLTPMWQTTADRLGAGQLYSAAELSSGTVAVSTDAGVRLLGDGGRPGMLLKSDGALAVDPRGRLLATMPVSGYHAPRAGSEIEIRKLNEKGKLSEPVSLHRPEAQVVDMKTSPDGSMLLLYVVHWKFTADGTTTDGEKSRGVELWETRNGQQQTLIPGNWPNDFDAWTVDPGATRLVSFDPEGITFHHVGHGGTAPTWTPPWGSGTPLDAAGTTSGDRAAVVTADGTTLWDLHPAQWRRSLCRIVGGGLSAEEWREYMPRGGEPPRSCPSR